MNKKNSKWLDSVNWDKDGLVAAIAQDYRTGTILMQAWMNSQSLALTASEQHAVYWSRSRGCLWRKGESSGHQQKIHEIRLDCDGDSVLLIVEQIGGIACHTGRKSCFYRTLNDHGEWLVVDKVLKDPASIYHNK